MSLVVDASIAVKWYVDEVGAEAAEAVLDSSETLFAPDLIFFEVGNALSKHVRIGTMAAEEAGRALEGLSNAVPAPTPLAALASHALALSIRHVHPIYDCAYLALALRVTGARLATADRRLATVATRAGVSLWQP